MERVSKVVSVALGLDVVCKCVVLFFVLGLETVFHFEPLAFSLAQPLGTSVTPETAHKRVSFRQTPTARVAFLSFFLPFCLVLFSHSLLSFTACMPDAHSYSVIHALSLFNHPRMPTQHSQSFFPSFSRSSLSFLHPLVPVSVLHPLVPLFLSFILSFLCFFPSFSRSQALYALFFY